MPRNRTTEPVRAWLEHTGDRALSFAVERGRPLARTLPAPVRRRLRSLSRRRSVRQVQLADLEAEMAIAARLFGESEDRAREHLAHIELVHPSGYPPDPLSAEYREWTWDLYRRVSGRGEYSLSNESSPFDVDEAVELPFPFLTRSPTVIGADLAARGRVLAGLGTTGVDLHPPARLIEFGPGWGNLTGDLLATGFEVTAVELEPRFCELLARRNPGRAGLSIVESDMLSYSTDEPVDAVVFFESFHHCADHLTMLERLHQLVVPHGCVVFAGEPLQDLAYPWGPRLDGLSLWSMRTYGWLELGFDSKYFRQALSSTGWHLLPLGFEAADHELLVARAQG